MRGNLLTLSKNHIQDVPLELAFLFVRPARLLILESLHHVVALVSQAASWKKLNLAAKPSNLMSQFYFEIYFLGLFNYTLRRGHGAG